MGETPLALASPFGRRPHWLGYTDKTHLSYGTLRERGFQILRVRADGREFV
ncbi:MAG: hypothetical protein V7L21_03665 [Nostoc sp.]|uniref:hypothetical protein n=1 Tax=Nostoc sp. TaxID=1180 RepID=UPI002FF9F02D|nr:hypothetical protein [Nostoc sp. NMS9]